jgi:diguanylate cyclase (GGDEF)-like protein
MASNQDSVDPSILQNIRQQLDGLKRTPDGMALHSLIERGLSRYGSEGGIARAFVKFLYVLLGNYIEKDNSDPATRVKARVMQKRLSPYLEPYSGSRSGARPEPSSISMETPVAPQTPKRSSRLRMVDALIRRRTETQLHQPAQTFPPAQESPGTGLDKTQAMFEPVSRVRSEQASEQAKVSRTATAAADTRINAGDDKRNQIEELHQIFASRVTDTLLKSQDFDGLLRANLKALELADKPGDIQDIKSLLMRGLGDLMQGYQEIEGNLKATKNYLEIAQQDRELLQNQVRVAMSHSSADRVTALPERAALEAQLDAEIGRAKRFGFSVALALIDLDNFGELNTRFGRDAGDEVLRYYASEVLLFRTYDLVARVGNDEFAVMFPNTQKEGALNALEKAQKRAAGLAINYKGRNIVLPTFTSVLTLYAPGERPRNLIQRAADTLRQVKTRGGDQLVVALPAS